MVLDIPLRNKSACKSYMAFRTKLPKFKYNFKCNQKGKWSKKWKLWYKFFHLAMIELRSKVYTAVVKIVWPAYITHTVP